MSIQPITQLQTKSVEETQRLGERIARQLRGGEILLLQGDLGKQAVQQAAIILCL